MKKAEVQKVFVAPKKPKAKRDFIFDSFEIIYKLDDKQVGRYQTSSSVRLFGDGKTSEHHLTWDEREDLDHAIGDVVNNVRTKWVKKPR
jgi:hypothetical protein